MSNQPLFHKVESFWRVQQTALILLFLFLTACTVLVQRWCSMLAHGLIPQWLTHPFFRPWCHMFYSSLAPLAGVLHWTAVQKSLSSPVSRRRFIDTRSGSELSKQIFTILLFSKHLLAKSKLHYLSSHGHLSLDWSAKVFLQNVTCYFWHTTTTAQTIFFFLHCVCWSPTSFVIQGGKW